MEEVKKYYGHQEKKYGTCMQVVSFYPSLSRESIFSAYIHDPNGIQAVSFILSHCYVPVIFHI